MGGSIVASGTFRCALESVYHVKYVAYTLENTEAHRHVCGHLKASVCMTKIRVIKGVLDDMECALKRRTHRRRHARISCVCTQN
ncbi:hypothetical protein BCEN4_600010 [Burkholderia cenocepacia]|nr:hypothetical protein BCEN4_600010 [Burkholderia cenocepacia]